MKNLALLIWLLGFPIVLFSGMIMYYYATHEIFHFSNNIMELFIFIAYIVLAGMIWER